MPALQTPNPKRPIDRRRITLYAKNDAQRNAILRAALQHAAEHGEKPHGALNRFCLLRITGGGDGGELAPELAAAIQNVFETWDADPYYHKAHGEALERLRALTVTASKKEEK